MDEKGMKYIIKGAVRIATEMSIKEILERKTGDKKDKRKYKKLCIKGLKEVRNFAKNNYPNEKSIYLDMAKEMLDFKKTK